MKQTLKQPNLITDLDELNKAIDAWGKRGAGWIKEGQTLALSALQRLHDHGDIGPVNRLQVAIPKGAKSASMAAWFLKHGALVANTGPDKKQKPFLYSREKAEQMGTKADMAGGQATTWISQGPQEKEPDDLFDLFGALSRLVNKAEHAARLNHPELLPALKALAAGVQDTPEKAPETSHAAPDEETLALAPPHSVSDAVGAGLAETLQAQADAETQAQEDAEALAGVAGAPQAEAVAEEPKKKWRRVRKEDAHA
jgi:hypothetical protein